jgi:hypothetical protein
MSGTAVVDPNVAKLRELIQPTFVPYSSYASKLSLRNSRLLHRSRLARARQLVNQRAAATARASNEAATLAASSAAMIRGGNMGAQFQPKVSVS